VDVGTVRVRRVIGRYPVSSEREEDTGEGKTREGPGHAGALTWWGRGMSAASPVCGVRVCHIGERRRLPCR
jgi:hypothetical protein